MNPYLSFGILLSISCSALATPPLVIDATPDNADIAVDPSLTTLRITFDRDMEPGTHSFCGGGPAMLPITGKPTWESARTILVPIKLEPDHLYSFSINCPSARNFISARGAGSDVEAAVPYPISFRTASVAGGRQPAFGAAEAAEMTAALRDCLNDRYSYRDRLKIDWTAAFAADTTLSSVKTPAAFARAAARFLAPANDPHLYLQVAGAGGPSNPDVRFTLATHVRNVTPNVNTRWLSSHVPGFKRLSSVASSGRYEDGIGYLMISSWGGSPADFAPIDAAMNDLIAANVTSLIVDVRPNGGGSESFARGFAAHFVDTPSVYSRSRIRDTNSPGGFSGPFDRTLEPSPQSTRFAGKVVVLMGPANLSSCESFLLMMKQSSRARLLGTSSGGSSGNPKPVDLGHGVVLLTPSWIDLLPDNTVLEGRGITPDEIVETTPAALETSDPVLDAALRWLRQK